MIYFIITFFVALFVLIVVISNKMEELDTRFKSLHGRIQELEDRLDKHNL